MASMEQATTAGQAATARLMVKCYRGVEELSLDLAPLTLLTGRNNAGKSSVLEALGIALSLPGLRDWMGRDVVRTVVDSKLGGLPSRLVRRGCTEARISLKLNNGETRDVAIRRLGVDDVRELTCWAMCRLAERLVRDVLEGRGLQRCLATGLGGGEEAAALASLLTAILADAVMDVAGRLCGERRCDYELPLPATLAYSLYSTSNIHLRDMLSKAFMDALGVLAEHMALLEYGGMRLVYPPASGVVPEDLWTRLSGQLAGAGDALVVKGETVLSVDAGVRDLYRAYVRLELSGVLRKAVHSCVPRYLVERVAKEVLRPVIELGGGRSISSSEVGPFLLLRRATGRLVDELRRAVERLHWHGLLGRYGLLLEPLGVKDPVVMGNEVFVNLVGEEGSVPATLLGDGTLQAMLVMAGLVLATEEEGAVVLVEEPETGLHPGYLMYLADMAAQAAQRRRATLIVLTTHSSELIEFLARRARERGTLGSLVVHLLRRGGLAASFHGPEVLEAGEIGAELRGL